MVRVHGEKPAFAFKPKSHVELCERLKLVDFARAAKLSGSGFLLYTNWGARLERALIQFMLDLHTREHGYTEVSPPFMVGPQCLEGVGQFPKFADQYYAVQEGLDAQHAGQAVPDSHGRDAGGEHSSRGDSAGEPAADLLLRLHAVFSRRSGRGGRGHARHDSRAPVRQGGVDQDREAGGRLRGAGEDAGERRAGAAVARACITAWCCCARATWASPAPRPTTSRSGRQGRGATWRFPACRIARISRRAG